MEYNNLEQSKIQENRILKLCKRLDKFTIEDILTVTEDIEENIMQDLLTKFVQEDKLIKNNKSYFFNKQKKLNKLRQPLFFQFHPKEVLNNCLRGFCSDVEIAKMINLFGYNKNVLDKFYNHFRCVIYEKQKQELLKHFSKTPKMPQERIYMNAKVYLYLYNGKLFVSDKYLISKNARKHREDERLEIKNIYLRSYRKVLSRSYAHKFHFHLAEEIWKYGKNFNESLDNLSKLL